MSGDSDKTSRWRWPSFLPDAFIRAPRTTCPVCEFVFVVAINHRSCRGVRVTAETDRRLPDSRWHFWRSIRGGHKASKPDCFLPAATYSLSFSPVALCVCVIMRKWREAWPIMRRIGCDGSLMSGVERTTWSGRADRARSTDRSSGGREFRDAVPRAAHFFSDAYEVRKRMH